jgi:hypothetical protein
MAKTATKQLVVCLSNEGYEASLERWKIYVMLQRGHGETWTRSHHRRIGRELSLPREMFRSVDLPQAVRKAVLSAA